MKLKKSLILFLSLSLFVSIFSIYAMAQEKSNSNFEFIATEQVDSEYPITIKETAEDGQIIYHKYAYNPIESTNTNLLKKTLDKTIKLNYTSTNDIPNLKYWEEYHDEVWFDGELDYVSHEKIYDGIWQVTFKGTLCQRKNK